MIRPAVALALALSASASLACDRANPGDPACGDGTWGIYLPGDQGSPAPNIRLKHFQHKSLDNRLGMGIAHEELMRLHDRVKPMSAAAFSASKSTFDVIIRYTLTPDKPAAFDMQTDGKEAEREQLTAFYNQAATLKDFHSKSGAVYVVFYYSISPAANSSGIPNK